MEEKKTCCSISISIIILCISSSAKFVYRIFVLNRSETVPLQVTLNAQFQDGTSVWSEQTAIVSGGTIFAVLTEGVAVGDTHTAHTFQDLVFDLGLLHWNKTIILSSLSKWILVIRLVSLIYIVFRYNRDTIRVIYI